ncbi:MAG: Integral rane protein [bacterium]|nr:Integral rane protein [bacterium]
MGKGRLEAFSDGVIAIIITIMVLELKVPHQPTWAALAERWPTFLSYLASFAFVGVYWGNHHHLVHTVRHVDPKIMWLNLHLLFWMSLIPFVTAWLGESRLAPVPTVSYGAIMLLAGLAYLFLQLAIAAQQTEERHRQAHQRQQWKAYLAMVCYTTGLPLAWTGHVYLAMALYVFIALAWAVPDRGLAGE